MRMNPHDLRFAYFGTPKFAVNVLNELEKAGFIPSLIITSPDKPQGRHLVLTPPEAKMWADAHGIPAIQPATLKTPEALESIQKYRGESDWDLFIVASYGKIIPQAILELPKHKVLNVHPSLLPCLRGASPIQSAILTENATGVSIMRLDEEMDHGPIIAQEEVLVNNWPPKADVLETLLAQEGGKLLARVIEPWIRGDIQEMPQDHSKATYCAKIEKSDGLIDLGGDPELNYRKIQAFSSWPTAYFFLEKNGKKTRIIVKDAYLIDGRLVLRRIIPEGRSEMSYEDFMRNW
jgi:methionyl-tRNA formyltransferase